MFMRRIMKPFMHSRRTLYTTPKIDNKYHEYTQFAISGTNCLLIVSILGYLEQYKEKIKLIDECNEKINSIYFHCMSVDRVIKDIEQKPNIPHVENNSNFSVNTIENSSKIPPIPMFIHDDNDT